MVEHPHSTTVSTEAKRMTMALNQSLPEILNMLFS